MNETTQYKAGPIALEYIRSNAFMDCIVGPIGSGKSAATVIKLLRKIHQQPVGNDGVRRSRWMIGRNSYRELKDTTIATFFQWVPRSAGIFSAGDFTFTMKARGADGIPVHSEILFRSFQGPDDARKLLSLELTGFWFNEAREIAKPIIDAATGRVGRYPAVKDGGQGWYGGMLDTNPCDRMHWLYKTFAQESHEGFKLFMQPGGEDEGAENLANLPKGYYKRIQAGKLQDWIDVYVGGKWGFAREGMPVYAEFNDRAHVPPEPIPYRLGEPVIVGIDFGLTPAAAILQRRPSGGYDWIAEVVTERAGALQFARELRPFLNANFPGSEVRAWADPAGRQGSQSDESTCFEVLHAEGIEAWPAATNVFQERAEAVRSMLSQLAIDGLPALRVSKSVQVGVIGMGGGYRYRIISGTNAGDRYSDQVEKNHYSHICEALGYALVGEGQGVRAKSARSARAVEYTRTRRATAGGM